MSKHKKVGFHYTGVIERKTIKDPEGTTVIFFPRYVPAEVKEKQEPPVWLKRLKTPGDAFMKTLFQNIHKRPHGRRKHKLNRKARLAA